MTIPPRLELFQGARRVVLVACGLGVALLLLSLASADLGVDVRAANRDDANRDDGEQRFCTQTAKLLHRACGSATQDDYWVAVAKCVNVGDARERRACMSDAELARREAGQMCRQQLDWRLGSCEGTGQARYDPEFDAAEFDADFAHLTNPNRYFPLGIGYRWEYRGADEFNTLEVLNQTKLVDDVRCIVVRDQVFKSGQLAENTDDWYAQNKDGNVWYCGEEVKDYESFDGDKPKAPELVKIDGSFKAGRDGDKAGIIFRAAPVAGEFYVEEFSLANAEDVTEILSAAYAFGKDKDLDRLVPERLARLFCSGDCVVTRNYSLLEPGIFARKYYAPGIGVFLEVEPETNSTLQLTSCNFDPRCASIPR